MHQPITHSTYGILDNQGAFDATYCGDSAGADCYRLDVGALTTETSIGSVDVSGNSVTFSMCPSISPMCLWRPEMTVPSTVQLAMGFDETTKIVNADPAISLSIDESITGKSFLVTLASTVKRLTPSQKPQSQSQKKYR